VETILCAAALLLSCTARPVDIPDTAVAPPPPPLDLSLAPDMPPPPRPQHNAQGWISSFGPRAYLTDARLDHDGNVYLYGKFYGDTVINHDKLTVPPASDFQLLVAKAGPDGAALRTGTCSWRAYRPRVRRRATTHGLIGAIQRALCLAPGEVPTTPLLETIVGV